VQITAVVLGGSRLDDRTPGIASFTAGMLDEGAGGRDAAALQAEAAFLGATLTTASDWDRILVSLKVPVRNLAPALDLMADVMLRPTFGAAEVRRQKDLRIANWLQLRDQPNALGTLAFNSVVFPAGHPYHNSANGDSAATASLDSTAVRAFYDRVMRPDRTTFVVVGDVTQGSITSALEKRFGAWTARGAAPHDPAISVAPLQQTSTRLYLVDKPNAAQSVVTIGWPGVDRRSPDYPALMVMNTMLGGSFTSRLNMNLRETRGYSYGASSGFAFRLVPGPFTASAAVRTNVTDSSLVEFFNELRGIRDRAPTDDELARARAYVELGLPQSLESTSQIASQIANLGVYGFTLQVLPNFASRVRAVTAADVQRVARTYLTPDRATVVVVGDLAQIRPAIEALKLGPTNVIEVRDLVR
jgi:predicted Zn-dependent peptidase